MAVPFFVLKTFTPTCKKIQMLLLKKEKPAKVVLAHTHAADLDQMNLI